MNAEPRVEYFATCPSGAEAILADEFVRLGFQAVEARRMGVCFTGGETDGWRACFWSRVASRVLLPLGEFAARDAGELYAGAMGIPWEDHLSSLNTFAVEGVGQSDALRHSGFLALKVKDAIADRMRKAVGRRPNVDKENPDVNVFVRLAEDRALVALDLAGHGLHVRGWRQRRVEAPLKGNLASAILYASGYDGRTPLVDPMCGSGTFAIEAAEIALGLGPGRLATFGFERWPTLTRMKKRLVADLRQEAAKGRPVEPPFIAAGDKDREAVAVAKANAERAGVTRAIRFGVKDARQAALPGRTGMLVTNPPYGERLNIPEEELLDLYAALGERWRGIGDGRLAVFCGHPQFRKAFGLKPASFVELYNGPIKARLYLYDIGARWSGEKESTQDDG
ncbi:MAG: RNA methyltransferase [Myxococcales bacterium]|nr:MAG: RNA methyltransferase [Myxococcales bacterium]